MGKCFDAPGVRWQIIIERDCALRPKFVWSAGGEGWGGRSQAALKLWEGRDLPRSLHETCLLLPTCVRAVIVDAVPQVGSRWEEATLKGEGLRCFPAAVLTTGAPKGLGSAVPM